jgi:hypothetical protein
MPDNIKFVKEDEAQSYSDELNRPSRMSFREGGIKPPTFPAKVKTRKEAEAQQEQQGSGAAVIENPDGTFSVVTDDEGYNFGYNEGGSSDKAALKKAIDANKLAMKMGDLLNISTPKEIKTNTAKPRNFKGTF